MKDPIGPMAVIDSCESLRGWLASRAGDAVKPAAMNALEHLQACARCREEALRADPTLLFALAAAEPPQPDWTGFNRQVRDEIERETGRGGFIGRLLDTGLFAPRRLVPAAAAAAILLAAFLAVRTAGTVSPEMAPAPPRSVDADVSGQGIPEDPAGHGTTSELMLADVSAGLPVESVDSPTAQLIWLPIEGEGEPGDLVLILDEGMDL